MSSQTIATFAPADTRIVESFRRKFPRQADNMLRLAVVVAARDALYGGKSEQLFGDILGRLTTERDTARDALASAQSRIAELEKMRGQNV